MNVYLYENDEYLEDMENVVFLPRVGEYIYSKSNCHNVRVTKVTHGDNVILEVE